MEPRIAVVGLGYVGLPLALALSKHFDVVGFDVDAQRIEDLRSGIDISGEVAEQDLQNCSIEFTSESVLLQQTTFVIICVPTPIDSHKKPDLTYLESASKVVGENMSGGVVVVYESTVYPGVTQEICVPILERYSGLTCGLDFRVGYSPERVNPGDAQRTIEKITKIVAGSDDIALKTVNDVYSKITTTHQATSIKVAEAAKVIENIQRDLNIALMNELAIIFDKMGLNVYDVLEAAGTKWNFHKYHPGLVGGHCIGVDPYYLTHKAEELGHHPQVILAGRRINDNMHKFYAQKIIKLLQKRGGKNVLILGLTFKPNVSDFRNSRVAHLISELQEFSLDVFAYDPFVTKDIVQSKFGAYFRDINSNLDDIDLMVLAVKHQKILNLTTQDSFSGKQIISLDELATSQNRSS
jgi:UDP-N-acetyl-D-glucosamine/UDP-N-acetyl-D-galactosamine dehydrogenase